MKVDELTDIELDLWVCKAEGYETANIYLSPRLCRELISEFNNVVHEIVVDGNFIVKIIERDKIEIQWREMVKDEYYCIAFSFLDEATWKLGKGKSALEAIKRCIVKRKYGETVE